MFREEHRAFCPGVPLDFSWHGTNVKLCHFSSSSINTDGPKIGQFWRKWRKSVKYRKNSVLPADLPLVLQKVHFLLKWLRITSVFCTFLKKWWNVMFSGHFLKYPENRCFLTFLLSSFCSDLAFLDGIFLNISPETMGQGRLKWPFCWFSRENQLFHVRSCLRMAYNRPLERRIGPYGAPILSSEALLRHRSESQSTAQDFILGLSPALEPAVRRDSCRIPYSASILLARR